MEKISKQKDGEKTKSQLQKERNQAYLNSKANLEGGEKNQENVKKPQQQQQQQQQNKPHGDKSSSQRSTDSKSHATPGHINTPSIQKSQNAQIPSSIITTTSQSSSYQLKLFDHLPKKSPSSVRPLIEGDLSLHPATIKLGCFYRTGIIRDDDDRTAALIATFCKVIEDYTTSSNGSLNRDLDKHIRVQVQHLVDNRQHCMGMGNLIKYLRSAISSMPPSLPESEAKQRLITILRQFLEEKIVFARESIIKHCLSIIRKDNNDVILTFGSSPLLRQVLLGMAETKSFRLVVVDTRPLNDGLLTLAALSPHIRCIYTPLSGVATIMREVNHVFLSASSLLSNGAVLAPAGTAMVASLAKVNRVPVVIIAESYKFSEKVQLDSIVYNELGNVSEIAYVDKKSGDVVSQTHLSRSGSSSSAGAYMGALEKTLTVEELSLSSTGSSSSSGGSGSGSTSSLHTQQQQQQLSHAHTTSYTHQQSQSQQQQSHSSSALPFQIINLRYDLTPMSQVSAVAAETGLIPPTSVPVLIREFLSDQKSQ